MIHYNKNIDQIDKKIISLLQKDASLSIKEISSQIGLSPSPCWNRIQKLQELGIIKKKTAILDPNKLGYNNRVFIFIKTSKHNKNWSEKFKNYILKQNNVLGLYRISGSYDYLIDVLSKNTVLSKALAYYRCTFQQNLQIERINELATNLLSKKIATPSLYLHGENDGCIGHYLSEGMEDYFEDLEIKILPDCGHFLHLEKKDITNQLILDFIN